MALEPRRLVCGDGEGVGVGLGEHVVAVDLGEDPPRGLLGDAVPQGPLKEPPPVQGDEVLVARLGEGTPDLVGLGGGHPRHVHDELDHLLLPDDDAIASLQGTPLQRVVVLPGRPMPVALHELGHRAALDADAGADEGHLVGQGPAGCGSGGAAPS